MRGARFRIEDAKGYVERMRENIKEFSEGKSLSFGTILGVVFEPLPLGSSELLSELEKFQSALSKFSGERTCQLYFELDIISPDAVEFANFLHGREEARAKLTQACGLSVPENALKKSEE